MGTKLHLILTTIFLVTLVIMRMVHHHNPQGSLLDKFKMVKKVDYYPLLFTYFRSGLISGNPKMSFAICHII